MHAPPWDPRFFERSPLFAPIAGAARAFASAEAFPTPEQIDEALAGRAGVRFVRQAPRGRRRRGPPDPASMYDARICRDGEVPTRPGSWHDLLNALVWATFPRAKRALHARQHELVVPGAPRRPPALDALALVDEGGVLVTGGGDAAPAVLAVFGHAIYESSVRGWTAPVAAAVSLELAPGGPSLVGADAAGFAAVDAALAAFVADRTRLTTPRDLRRIALA